MAFCEPPSAPGRMRPQCPELGWALCHKTSLKGLCRKLIKDKLIKGKALQRGALWMWQIPEVSKKLSELIQLFRKPLFSGHSASHAWWRRVCSWSWDEMWDVPAPRSTDLSGTTLGCCTIKFKEKNFARFDVEKKFSHWLGLQGLLLSSLFISLLLLLLLVVVVSLLLLLLLLHSCFSI